jgi:hypothetical protein
MRRATIDKRQVPQQGGGYKEEYYISIPGGYIAKSGRLTTDVAEAQGFDYESAARFVAEEHGYTVAHWVTRTCQTCGMTCDDERGKPISFDMSDPAVRQQTFQCHSCFTLSNRLLAQ